MNLLEKNVGSLDRMVRIVVGVALLAGGLLYAQAPVSYLVLVAGLVLTGTGVLGSCALYTIAGIDTMEKKAKRR